MSVINGTYTHAELAGMGRHAKTKTREPSFVSAPSKAEIYARAEQRMKFGKKLVISGFVVAVAGIVGYCIACFSAAASQELGSAFLENPGWLAVPTLGVIGLGTLLWLVGSFLYLSGGMDSDPDGPNLYF